MAYTDAKIIGEVTEVTGDAKIIRTDGTEEPIILGSPIYEGDIVETTGAGAVNIGFIDESSFAVSSDARIAIDEFVFDPASESGAQDFSVLRGVFMYTSGLIGRENPDSVEIDTPVGSIGIRGTIIGGTINPDGESQVTVIEGAIVVRNDGGERLLSVQYDTVTLNSLSQAPSDVTTLSVKDVANNFSAVKDVSAGLFSSFNDQMQQEGPSNNLDESSVDDNAEQQAEEQAAAEETPVSDDVVVNENKAVELKTMGGDRKSASGGQDLDGRDAATEPRDIRGDDATNIRFLEKISDQNFTFTGANSIDESTASGTVIGTVAPTRALPFGVTYSLASDANGTLQINPKTGVISLKTSAENFETVAHANYDVQVVMTRTDTGASKQISVPLTLNDVNESAQISANTTAIIGEDDVGLTADTVVSNLSFIEADTKTPSFQTQFTTSDDRFRVDMNAGQLQLVAIAGEIFDYETEQSVTVTITQNDGLNVSDYDVTVNVTNLIDETPTNITVDVSTVDENASNGDIVATLSTVDNDGVADSFTYEILGGNDGNIFGIDANGRIIISDNTNLDYETTTAYDLNIRTTDSNGHSYDKVISLGVNDINEAAAINLGLEDIYSITDGNSNGLLPTGVSGAVIGKLNISDPESTSFTAADFSIIGGMGAHFEVAHVNGEFILKLKDGLWIVDSTGYKITDGSNYTPIGGDFNLSVLLNETDFSTSQSFSVSIGTPSSSGPIQLGTETNDTFTVTGNDFKLIRGGEGYDLLILNGVNGGVADTFDFRSTVSNTIGNSADLKSIEEIRITYDSNDEQNVLKMNIADVFDLLRTSDNGALKFSSPGASSKVEFFDSGAKETLTENGFIDGGSSGVFHVYTHDLGDVLIQENIVGAIGGGSVV